MNSLFYCFIKNLLGSFSPRNLRWHLVAIILTYLIVISDFDWQYYQYFSGTAIKAALLPAVLIGALFPIFIPLAFIALGAARKNFALKNAGWAIGQAAILGSFISSFYKFFTGRAHPSFAVNLTSDITHIFQFGINRGGIFWGWPSSHTTIAFAMAFTIWVLFPNKLVRFLAVLYALFIGIAVSMSIHWFSDFVAGMIIGTIIGLTVGHSFKKRYKQ